MKSAESLSLKRTLMSGEMSSSCMDAAVWLANPMIKWWWRYEFTCTCGERMAECEAAHRGVPGRQAVRARGGGAGGARGSSRGLAMMGLRDNTTHRGGIYHGRDGLVENIAGTDPVQPDRLACQVAKVEWDRELREVCRGHTAAETIACRDRPQAKH